MTAFRNAPVAIDIDPHYSDELWVKDCRFEQISKAAVIISNEKSPLTESPDLRMRYLLKDAPYRPALFRESGKTVSGKGAIYNVASFNYGLIVPGEGSTGTMGMIYDASALNAAIRSALSPAIPAIAAY